MAADEGWRAAVLARLRARLARLKHLTKDLAKVAPARPANQSAPDRAQDKARSIVRR